MTDLPVGARAWWYPGTSVVDAQNEDRLACKVVRYLRDDLACVRLLSTGREVCIFKDRVTSRAERRNTARRKHKLSPRRPKEIDMAGKPTVRELRRSAKSLGVDGWEDMEEAELAKAVTAAQSRSAKRASKATAVKKVAKAPAKGAKPATGKKAPAKAEREVAENGNPFKEGTNMYLITEQLIKGGKRSKMVATLKKQITLEPRSKDPKKFDVDSEMDRRVLITGQILRNEHGFDVTREGRGTDATIVAVAP